MTNETYVSFNIETQINQVNNLQSKVQNIRTVHIYSNKQVWIIFPCFVMDLYVQFFLRVPKNTGKGRRL